MNIKIVALPEIYAETYRDDGKFFPGGAALNFAVHASEFTGVDVTLLGAIGNDENGSRITGKIGYRRIDITNLRTEKKKATAARNISKRISRGNGPDSDGMQAEEENNGENALNGYKLGKKEKSELMIADAVFTAYSCACFEEILELKREYGFKLAVDFGDSADLDQIDGLCDDIDIVLINGTEDKMDGIRRLAAAHTGIFSLLMRDAGAFTCRGSEEYRHPAAKPDEFVDCTGCEDSYHAAFVCSFFKDKDIDKAMQLAAELEAITCEHPGNF